MAPPDARHGGLEVGSSEVAVVVIEGTHELPISHSYYFLLLTDWGADILGHAPRQRTKNLSTVLAVYSCLQQGEKTHLYTVGRPLIHKVLKTRIGEFPRPAWAAGGTPQILIFKP